MLTRKANMKFEDLTPEQQELVKTCKTPEEMFEAAKSIGYVLSDEELDAMSGGGFWDFDDSNVCPTRY
ncbi:MAG: Nif11-like leader peptide family natural product precursor [Atopobiaceae bacterium]|nr:Nif11-like leader peptide family natural product precursor [Atopobiaceae bacterium]